VVDWLLTHHGRLRGLHPRSGARFRSDRQCSCPHHAVAR